MSDLVTENKLVEAVEWQGAVDGRSCDDVEKATENTYNDDEDVLSANESVSDEDPEGETNADDIDEQESMDKGSEEMPDGLLGYKYKRVLKHDSPMNSTEPLPEGWVMATHSCGFPLYFHKKSRVITWSRPYSLLTGYVMKHKIPLQSIPCLHYLKTRQKMEEVDKQSGENKTNGDVSESIDTDSVTREKTDPNCESMETSHGSSISQPKVILHQPEDLSLDDEELKEYLENRFIFETLKIPQFKKWSQRRDFNRSMKRKNLGEVQNASEDGEKTGESKAGSVITLTVEQDGPGGSTRNKKFILNTTGKPMICILHEYAQRVLRVQPHYIFAIREDAAEPFEASIKLNDKVYGTAVAINKKTAKNKAALATLEMLVPGFKGQVESAQGSPDMNCFNKVAVTDSRVHELCVHTGQLLPYQVLTECLKRHQGIADTNVSFDVQQGKRRSLNYTMICGKHVVTGAAKNKKLGKQFAAQKILELLHPEVKTWAELIKLYGTSLAQERAKRKQEEQEIFDLKQRRGQNEDDDSDATNSSKVVGNEEKPSLEPNPELLAKLREMMFKLKTAQDKRKQIESDEAISSKKQKLTPMAAAVLAGKGLFENSPTEGNLTASSSVTARERLSN